MRALIIFVYLVLLLFRGYAGTDRAHHDKPVCTYQALKKASSGDEQLSLMAMEAEENDDHDLAKKFKCTSIPSTLSHTIVVSHIHNSFHNRLQVCHAVPYRYIVIRSLRI